MDSLNRKDQHQQQQMYRDGSAELYSDGEGEGEGVEVTKEDGVAAAAAASR
jgi:hypothetical protein